jgi:membrane fusion protein (multidrug efflux system)
MSEEVAGKNGEDQEIIDDTHTDAAPENGDGNETPAPEPEKKNGNGKRRRLFIIGGVVLLVAVIAGVGYWLYERQFESTDDAFIEGDITQISPKVSAYISRIYVKNNQLVHKGDLLVELDPKDFEAKLEQARAQLRVTQAQHGQAQANVDLTRKTTGASQSQARSNVETARNNVAQNRAASEAKRSQILQAQTAVKTAQANLAQTRAQIQQAEGDLHLAQVEFDRRQKLYDNGDISKQNLDQATSALQTARSQFNSAQKQIDAAQSRVDEARANVSTAQENFHQSEAQVDLSKSQVGESAGRLEDANAAPERVSVSESQVGTSEASIEQAEAAVHQAELELSYTKVFAPEEGYITRKTIEEGQLVQIGAPLMAISQSNEVWVTANFKETQLGLMHPGQTVDIYIDAYPNQTFRGRVESFQAGTGSRFSVLPPENATGNYVKVVQRIPVKIVFDPPPDDAHRLVPGMSVQPTVRVR